MKSISQIRPPAARFAAVTHHNLLQRKCACGGSRGVSGEWAECEQKQLQRKSAGRSDSTEAPPIVYDVIKSAGRPLDGRAKSFFESSFGYDFGRVRVHDDPRAAESARAVNAHAYTVGRDIAFAGGCYEPRSASGVRLLAHELTHVVQQEHHTFTSAPQLRVGAADDSFEREADRTAERLTSAPEAAAKHSMQAGLWLQRDDDKSKSATRIDVAIVLDASDLAFDEARTYAPTVLRVTSAEDAKKKLTALGQPIGTLYVVSHSNRLGEVEVESSIGTISWVKISEFGKGLKGALPGDKAPSNVDFRGCKLGEAPEQMESFQKSVGAASARAFNCWSFAQRVTPLTAPDGTEIKKPSDIPAGRKKEFDQKLWQQVAGLKAANGTKVKDCLIGLAKGEKATLKNFQKIKDLYFKNNGLLVAGWASPEFNEEWQEGSICTKEMTESTSPCKIVKTPTSSGGGSGKQSSMTIPSTSTSVADVSEAAGEDAIA